MKKFPFALIAAGSLSLGGCAAGLGGPTGGLGSVLGSVLGGPYAGQGGPSFQEAAIDACGREASRYGQVRVLDVDQLSRDTLRVEGTIRTNFQQAAFGCSFRADGRITDFDVR